VTSAILRQFSVVSSAPVALPVVASTQPLAPQTGGVHVPFARDEDPNFKTVDGNLFLKYPINFKVDSLSGLALKFGLQVSYLKQINKLHSDLDFYSLRFVLVPWKPGTPIPHQSDSIEKQKEEEMDCLVSQFSSELKIDSAEAKWYLHDSAYSYADAMRQYKADIEWEKQHNVVYSDQTRV